MLILACRTDRGAGAAGLRSTAAVPQIVPRRGTVVASQ